MTNETIKTERSELAGAKLFAIGFIVWFVTMCAGIAARDMFISKCKVAAIEKGMTAAEVAVACK